MSYQKNYSLSLLKGRFVFMSPPPEKTPASESREGQQGETMASNVDVNKTMNDANKMLAEFKKDYEVQLPADFFRGDAELNVDEIYNSIYDKVSLTDEKIIDAVAKSFVDYAYALRDFKKAVDSGAQISTANLNMFKDAVKQFQYEEVMLHDPMGAGSAQRREIPTASAQAPSAVASAQPGSTPDAERLTAAEKAEGDKNNYVSNIGFMVIDGQKISPQEETKTLAYLKELGGSVQSYNMDNEADVVITAENGKIKVTYKSEQDASTKIKERTYYANISGKSDEQTA